MQQGLENGDSNLSSSPLRGGGLGRVFDDSSAANNSNKSQLADYFANIAEGSPAKNSNPNTTSFAKLNSENTKNATIGAAINIAFTQKDKANAVANASKTDAKPQPVAAPTNKM